MTDARPGYLERRHRRRWLALAAIALLASCAVFGAVALAPDDPCDAPEAAPAGETALMPEGLSFDGIGTVTSVRTDGPHVMIDAVANAPLDEVTVLIQDAVVAAGYRFAGMDTEAFEAEVFFTTGSYAAGQARVRPSSCQGRWNVDLVLLDPDAVPPSETVPTTTS